MIGIYTVAFFALRKRNLGASSVYGAALEAMRGADRPGHMDLTRPDDPLALPRSASDPAPRWRLGWLLGLVLAGAVNARLGGAGGGGADLTGFVDTFRGFPLWARLAVLGGGGVLIGFGTRMSGGCTSGHAISGISQRQWPSLWATLTFFAVGMAVSFALRACLGG